MFGSGKPKLKGWRSLERGSTQYLLLRLTYPRGKWKIVDVTDQKSVKDRWVTQYLDGSSSIEYHIFNARAWD